jgi:hypothetical protein
MILNPLITVITKPIPNMCDVRVILNLSVTVEKNLYAQVNFNGKAKFPVYGTEAKCMADTVQS